MKTFCLRRDKKSTGTWRAFRFSAFPPTRLLTRRCGRCQIAHRSLGEQFSLTLFLWTYEILQPRDIAALWKASVRHLLRIRRVGRTFNGRSCYAFCCLLIKYLMHCIYIFHVWEYAFMSSRLDHQLMTSENEIENVPEAEKKKQSKNVKLPTNKNVHRLSFHFYGLSH